MAKFHARNVKALMTVRLWKFSTHSEISAKDSIKWRRFFLASSDKLSAGHC